MKITKKHLIIFVLILAILFGVFFRFYNLNYPFLSVDDQVFAVSALKIHHQSFEDGVKYVWNHPPLGKYLAGILTINSYDESFAILNYIPEQMFGYAHLAYQPLQKTMFLLHFSYFLFGVLSIFMVYLITKKVYSNGAALWAAALFSLSLDFIGMSRSLYPEHFMIFFTLTCLYFYMEYIYSSRRNIHLILFGVSLLFLVNSRQFQPVLIAFIFLLHYVARNFFKTKMNIERTVIKSLDIIAIYAVVAISTLIIYRPLPPERFTHSSLLHFGFQIHKIFAVLVFRNSYISLLGLVLLIYFAYINRGYIKKLIESPIRFFGKKNIILYMFILSIFSMLFFDFPYLVTSRYFSYILVFAVILQGVALEKIMKINKKFISIVVILVLALSFYQVYDASKNHPPFVLNSNFNIEAFVLFSHVYGTGYNYTIYDELREMGNPKIITNLAWLAIYYEGEIIIPPLPNSNICNEDFFETLKGNNTLLIVKIPDFFTKEPWASCEEFRLLNFSKIKTLALDNEFGADDVRELAFYRIV